MSDDNYATEGWAQLVSTTDTVSDPIIINKDKFLLGRGKNADLSLVGNKMVSGTHCIIQKEQDGSVWIQDTSTNGTLINFSKKLNGTKVELHHGDEIHLVYKKNSPEHNISYLYQDLGELQREELDATQEYSSELDIMELDSAKDSLGGKKRSAEDQAEEEPLPKKKKKEELQSNSSSESTLPPASDPVAEENIETKDTGTCTKAEDKKSGDKVEVEDDPYEETMMCIICQDILHNCVSLQPCMHSFCGGCFSDWMNRSRECPSCRGEVERVSKNHLVNNLVEVYLKQHPEKRRPESELKELDAKNKITHDKFYPPEPERPIEDDDDEDEEEEENEDEGDGNGSGSQSSSGSDSDSEEPEQDTGFTSVITTYGTPIYMGNVKAPKVVCRQCPVNQGTLKGAVNAVGSMVSNFVNKFKGVTAGTSGAGDPPAAPQPSTSGGTTTEPTAGPSGDGGSDVRQTPVYPDYTCDQNQTHIVCQCCLEPMPDRRAERTHNPDAVPPIQCQICYRSFCSAYWGCQRIDCYGCISLFKDMNFNRKCLASLILDNGYESTIFQHYIESRHITIQDVLKQCLTKLDTKEYTCSAMIPVQNVNSNTAICYSCGLRQFKELAYQYRRDIPRNDLPAGALSRPDCYWGKNCRTQKNKPHHAMTYNHVCEQTRTT